MTLDNFHFLIGQTVMYCQVIEHDVKCIYAAMHDGDYYDNLDKIQRLSLGQSVLSLKELDLAGKRQYLSSADYDYLKQITDRRNHWCHQTYQNFLYNPRFLQSKEYAEECRLLERDNARLSKVFDALEDIKKQVLKDFGRV